MVLSFKTCTQVKLNFQVLRDKILLYLQDSEYQIIEEKGNHIIFKEDEFSSKRATQGNYYTKVDAGKFEIGPNEERTNLKLSYRISVIWEFVFLTIVFALGVYVEIRALLLGIAILINLDAKCITYTLDYLIPSSKMARDNKIHSQNFFLLKN